MFAHNWLPRFDVRRIDSPAGRKYQSPNNNRYESVTTWLGRSQDNTWLREWKNNVGEREATKIVKRASARGTQLHENVELYLKNNIVDSSLMSMLDKSLFNPFKTILNVHVNNVHALEYPLWSDVMRLGGTVDCIAEFDGVLSLIDFKTSKNRKSKEDIDDYFIQCTIYSLMIQEMYKIRVDQIVVLMAVDYENHVQIFKESRVDWIPTLIKRLKQYPPERE